MPGRLTPPMPESVSPQWASNALTSIGPSPYTMHVFVSTAGAFRSFDAGTMSEVGRVSWVGGGLSPPAIG